MDKLKNFYFKYWPTFLVLLVSIILTLSIDIFLHTNLHLLHKRVFLFNVILLFVAFKFIQSITNQYWISLAILMSIYLILLVANIAKLELRDEPILPFDLVMAKDLPSLIRMINPLYLFATIILIILLIFICICLLRKLPIKKQNWKRRLFWLFPAILLFGSSVYWNHSNTIFYKINSSIIKNDPEFWNQKQGAEANGILTQFLNNIDVKIMNKPNNYSKSKIIKIIHKYQKNARLINEHRPNNISKQIVIFNLSESFANPERVPAIELNKNPIPRIDNIKQHTTSGLMMSSGYGGGTANMEYMTLTGFATCNFASTMSSPYTQLVPHQSYIPTFNQSFKYSTGIHPYKGEFYNRIDNYKKFRFNKFSYLGNKKCPIKHLKKLGANQYQSDQTAYDNLFDQLNRYRSGQFINLITMQNHLPYQNLYKNKAIKVKSSNGSDVSQIENYATGISYSDKAVKYAIKKIDKINRPITIVFYGDHLPAAGYKNNMRKDGIKLHETDYFIYSNQAAKRLGAKNLVKHIKYVSPSNFIAMVLKQTRSKVTPYQALLTQIYNQLPAFSIDSTARSTNPQFINNDGKKVKLTKRQKKLWDDYLLIQYDQTAGQDYSSHFHFYK